MRRERGHLFRHQLLFMLGLLAGLVGAYVSGLSRAAGGTLFLAGAGCWFGSGLSAIVGGRHMFGTIGPAGLGNARVRPAGRGRIGAAVVGAILMLLSLGLVNVAVNLFAAS